MNGDFSHLGTEDETLDTDEVTDIEKLLEHFIVEFLVLTRAQVITGDIHLYAPL